MHLSGAARKGMQFWEQKGKALYSSDCENNKNKCLMTAM